MNSEKKKNRNLLAVSLFLSSIIIGLNTPKISAQETNFGDTSPDVVNVEPVTSTVSTNMLNVNSAVITKANVQRIEGKNQDIKVKFSDVPQVEEKIFAVLVDEIVGGVIQAQYLDENNSVEFKNVMEYIKIPGIHLYKQSPEDPDFTLRKYNFIASTSYLMPYGKKITNNGGLETPLVNAYKADGTQYGSSTPQAQLYTTTVPNVYSLAIPSNFFSYIDNGSGVNASNVLAAVISYESEDTTKQPVDVRQWVSTNYNESGYICRFEFLLPEGVKNIQVHLYKEGLYENTFLCKFLIDIEKQAATNYSLDG